MPMSNHPTTHNSLTTVCTHAAKITHIGPTTITRKPQIPLNQTEVNYSPT